MSLLKFAKGMPEVKWAQPPHFHNSSVILEFWLMLKDNVKNSEIKLNNIVEYEIFCGCEDLDSVRDPMHKPIGLDPTCLAHSLDYDVHSNILMPTYILETDAGNLRLPKNFLQIRDMFYFCGNNFEKVKEGNMYIKIVDGLNRLYNHLPKTEDDPKGRMHVQFVEKTNA